MHETEFAAAASPPKAVVLCLPLKPYSIGHEIELWRQSNPLLVSTWVEFNAISATKQREWLIRAVDLCSQDHDEWLESERILQFRPRWWRLDAWLRKSRLEATWSRWRAVLCKMTEVEWQMAVADFRNYLIAGRSCPPSPSESGYKYANGDPDSKPGRQLGSPVLARAMNFLSDKPSLLDGCSVYDFSFGLALWLCFTDAEMEGTVVIENEAEREVDEKEKKLLAEIEAERKSEKLKAETETSCQV